MNDCARCKRLRHDLEEKSRQAESYFELSRYYAEQLAAARVQAEEHGRRIDAVAQRVDTVLGKMHGS